VNTKVTPGEIVVMAGGGVALIFSFLPFYTVDFGGDTSAWGSGLFPVATFIAMFAAAAGILVALNKFANVSFPAGGVLGIGWNAFLLVLTFYAALLAFGFLIVDNGGVDRGVGFWFMLIGAIASFVGAILMQNEARTGASGPSGPPRV
jgi:hypothetical protein